MGYVEEDVCVVPSYLTIFTRVFLVSCIFIVTVLYDLILHTRVRSRYGLNEVPTYTSMNACLFNLTKKSKTI